MGQSKIVSGDVLRTVLESMFWKDIPALDGLNGVTVTAEGIDAETLRALNLSENELVLIAPVSSALHRAQDEAELRRALQRELDYLRSRLIEQDVLLDKLRDTVGELSKNLDGLAPASVERYWPGREAQHIHPEVGNGSDRKVPISS